MKTTVLMLAFALTLGVWGGSPARAAEPASQGGVFAKSNLVAWCIVPFDSLKRGPKARAEMLQRLGIRKFAYDWRSEHVPSFEEEIVQTKKHGIEYFAFWGQHKDIFPLLAKHQVKPQFWAMIPNRGDVEAAAKDLLPLVGKIRECGCKLALYNHGGWAGEPDNMVAVVKRLRQGGNADHVGIVYNLHHGHDHIRDFPQVLAAMKPYLFCLNLNGMNDGARPKILPIGSGQHDQEMMETIRRSGYSGPLGILCHRDVDAEVALKQNLDGMKKVLKQMGDEAALKTYD